MDIKNANCIWIVYCLKKYQGFNQGFVFKFQGFHGFFFLQISRIFSKISSSTYYSNNDDIITGIFCSSH